MYQTDIFPSRWTRVSLKAQDKNFVFENLLTHFHVDSFKEAFKALDGTKARGVDGISKSEYGKNLEENLKNLEQKVKRGSYRPLPKKEVLIPKANGKTRPICISCFEDKIVDWVIGKILTQVYEPLFIRTSFGYRPRKSADDAIKACYYSLIKNKRQHVVEIDFSNFFNTIPHRKLMKILGKKILDNRFKGLIGRFLVGDLISHDGDFYGVIIRMFFEDHSPPHFHAEYNEYELLVGISPIKVLKGKAPKRVESMVLEWAAIHQDKLLIDWDLCSKPEKPKKIEPLE